MPPSSNVLFDSAPLPPPEPEAAARWPLLKLKGSLGPSGGAEAVLTLFAGGGGGCNCAIPAAAGGACTPSKPGRGPICGDPRRPRCERAIRSQLSESGKGTDEIGSGK